MASSRNRIVVKVGSSLLANEERFTPRYAFMNGLLSDIAELQSEGYEVALASSGSVALGLKTMGLTPQAAGVQEKQAAAACGQPILLNAYKQIANEFGLDIAQVLVTLDDLENRRRFLNSKNTIHRLLERGIVPIVNENDTITTQEIRVGDNDRLSAKVAQMIDATQLVILTSVDGLYDRDPSDPEATLVEEVEDVNEYLDVTTGVSDLGSGGMLTKMQAANMAQNSGCATLIGRGSIDRPVSSIIKNDRPHTRCIAKNAIPSWKVWLTDRLQMAGSIVLANDVVDAVCAGDRPIHCGDVVSMQGDFDKADVLHVFDENGNERIRGLSNLAARDALLLKRNPVTPPAELLGYDASGTLINQNNLVVLEDRHVTWDPPEEGLTLVAG
ncbi:MAG: glutamate 5-kinase [Parvularculaceae bacterium]